MVKRKEYLDLLDQWREKQLIKVLSGVRRCGKSTLLAQYIERLKASGVEEGRIISVNLESAEFEGLCQYRALHDYIEKRLAGDRFTYVFIDEVQQCPQFEKAVDSLFIKKNTDIYITGSNAFMLSGELATLLSGRYVEIKMLPLSFKEYTAFTKTGPDRLKEAFNDYIRFGSFPYTATLEKNAGLIEGYIDGIYNTILVKDIAKREGIRDMAVLESMVKFLSAHTGSPISAKKIGDTMNSAGRKISVNTVETYLRALCDAYIFYKADRYDIQGKQHLKTLGKYYIVDTGIRNMLLPGGRADLGHQLENIIYLELLRRSRRVYIGKWGEREIDFIAEGPIDGIAYYQVAATVLDPDTLNRELEALRKIRDNHPKYLLTLDEYMPNANHEGIIQLNALQWLAGQQ
jgi:predicted AAA+ superfamily ATPase